MTEIEHLVQAAPAGRRHIPALDGLRGLAVFAVMASHLNLPVFRGGFVGVDVFFVLSGFLITTLILQEWWETGGLSFRNFYMRRALRLFPAFLLLIAAFLAFTVLASESKKPAIYALLYISNWARALQWDVDMGLLGHTWSLSIEEQFYLVWPVVLYALLRWNGSWKAKVGTVAAAILLCTLWRWQCWDTTHADARLDRVYNGFFTRADALLLGCLLAMSFSRGQVALAWAASGLQKVAVAVSSVFLLWVTYSIPLHGSWVFPAGQSLIVLAAGVLVASAAVKPPRLLQAVLENRFLVWAGKLSYGLYLWHYPIFELTMSMSGPQAVTLPLRIGAAFLAAVLSYYLWERPFLKLKKRFETPAPSRAEASLDRRTAEAI